MPLPGGPSDKAGNRYEARWTVACMARVLRRQYGSIRLEPPGPEGQGIEFWLQREDGREYHQVKRQGGRRGHWSLRELNDAGVLASFRNRLTDAHAKCVFVSSQDAHELRELAERARSASDLQEFEREFAQGGWGSHFGDLRTYWHECTNSEAFSFLRRIRVRTIDEETLRRHAEIELAPMIDGDASAASEMLFAYAFESVHKELTSSQITDHLRSHGFNRPIWSDPHTLADVVQKANERYTTRLQRELIRAEVIQRNEVARVLAALQQDSAKRGVIVTGAAGSGKSTVLLQVIESIRRKDIPALAVRVDNLAPTQSPDEAGRQMELPKSPVATLAALAGGRCCVLILDQLDAVSLASGRNPDFFECFDEMIRQALTLPEMRVVIACRRFDFDNDHRLRRLGGSDNHFEHVEIGLLSDDVVRGAVRALGIEPSRLTDKQVELLSVPAQLKLMCEVAQGAGASLTFQTANDLYGLYWSRKDQLLRVRLGPTIAWSSVLDKLCDYMSESQVLSAPATILDDASSVRDALLSEHVLVQDGARLSFFHEGFFDYAFARRFAATGGDLIGLLRSSEQHLFRRAQVRQILLHQREADRPVYLDNLRVLLTSADIRFHIRQVVFALLAQLADPTEPEWRILESLLLDPAYPNRGEIWSVILRLPWFKLLDSLGVVKAWLRQSDPDTVNSAVLLLRAVQRDAADRVAELVEPYVGTSEDWRNRHRFLVQQGDLSAGRRFFDLFLKLIDSGDIDSTVRTQQGDFIDLLYELPDKRADWACEAIGHYLTRCLNVSLEASKTNPFGADTGLGYSQSSDRVLIGSAQRATHAFIEHIFPVIQRVIELNAERDGEKPWSDTVWRWRRYGDGHGVDDHLIRAAEEALRKLAREFPDEFGHLAESLRHSEYETLQFLLIRAYSANGQRFADEAIDYICELPRRLSCGYLDSSHRASRELIEAATPHCSSDRLAKLEAMLLEYYSEWEQTSNGRRSRGLTQFELLLAIDEKRRSDSVRARIGEWQRKFGIDAPPEPPRSGVFHVDSPIPANAAEKMTDEQWLAAVARYATEASEWRDGEPVGGAHELSQMLEGEIRKDSQRFANLVLRFPDETNPAYFHAVLRGLDGGVASNEAIFEACRRCHRLPKRPASSAFCHLVEKLPELPWPDDLLDATAWYATEDSHPDRELWRTEASGGQCYYGGDIYTAGINCVRGAAAGAVRALLFADAQRIPRFLPTLRRMVRDRSIAVRSCVVTALFPVLNHDRGLALELFLELCDTEDVLLRTHYAEEFMRYATLTHFGPLRTIFERMLRSDDPEVAQTGARRACVASLGLEEAADLAEQCLAGSEPLRVGAAQVFAANVGGSRFRSVCESRLMPFFDDPGEKVRATAAECFDHLKGEALGQVPNLIERFQGSAAFAANHEYLIRALETTTARLPDVTISICQRFVESLGAAAVDKRARTAYVADQLSGLVIRTYHQAADQAIRNRCLDTIDNLLRVSATGLERVLVDFER